MANKGLLIKSYTDKTGSRAVWNELDDTHSYIQGIRTAEVQEGGKADILSSLISGLPSPWARAKLFEFALKTLNTPDPNIARAGLMTVYDGIHGEWRGLIALIALFGDRISFSMPIYLDYRGANYDIAAAMGRMLFDERDIWSNQDKLAQNKDELPFLHLIYYNKVLIGGTSPLTGVFTGVSYDLGTTGDIPWYRNGKLEDPSKHLNTDQLNKVYIFVRNLRSNIVDYERKINSCRAGRPMIELTGFKGMLERWENELDNIGQGALRKQGPIASYNNLSSPIADLFYSNVPVYLKSDFSFTYTQPSGEYQTIGDIQSLLSEHQAVLGWIDGGTDGRNYLENAPAYYLRVEDISTGAKYFFTVPLSERALTIFRTSISNLLGYGAEQRTKLTAKLTEEGKLAVTMTLDIDGAPVALNTREYTITWMDTGRVILWPNFQSENWTHYYLYTEFTGNAEQRFYPIFSDKNGYICEEHQADKLYVYRGGDGGHPDVKPECLVTYPGLDKVQSDKPVYDILCTERPVGVLAATTRLEGVDVSAGYLIIRTDKAGLEDLGENLHRQEATVGIDFGSNNTCLYYSTNQGDPQPIKFENTRLVLVGQENHNQRALADLNELLFFSNTPALKGQFKSWLHEHEETYNANQQHREIAGGVPVNRNNIYVREMDAFKIITQAGILHYNMKWLDDAKGLMKKKAFLKSLWLQACASLFRMQAKPVKVYWSYPGSMMQSDVNNLEQIFEELCTRLRPIKFAAPRLSETLMTEAEAVCRYALSQDFGLTERNLILGIDVGGSTSDILLLAKDPQNGYHNTLLHESSVRIAAGVFGDAIKKSDAFRQAVYSFHEGNGRSVYLENIKDILSMPEKAPFFLTGIFDQLDEEGFDTFYTSMSERNKRIFVIPAYITGLLLYYSGILIGKTLHKYNLTEIKEVYVLAFGKGGRIFHWLTNTPGSRLTKEYYRDCLNAGVALILEDCNIRVDFRDEEKIRLDNKAEVAKGMCTDMSNLRTQNRAEMHDICGEDGVRYMQADGSPLSFNTDSELYADYFQELSRFSFNETPNFEGFMEIFYDFVSERTDICRDARTLLEGDLRDLPGRISSLLANDPEYRKAQRNAGNGKFAYHQPILIAEGLAFLRTIVEKLLN